MTTTLDQTSLRSLIAGEHESLTELRRDLHRCPELMFEERQTAERVAAELTKLGIEHTTGYAPAEGEPSGTGTGIVAHLPATTGSQGPSVALRADMDALPIIEATGKPYASEKPGVMHACGHDGHTAILVGAARVLSKVERPNPVTLIFQPGEEGGAGGEKMCNEGCLAGAGKGGLGAPVGRIYGLHGWPLLDVGHAASKPGPLLASTDEFRITIKGTQAHGAYPHFGTDQILAGAHIVTALQSIASRNVAPLDSIVVTVGAFNGGSAPNIIPADVQLVGTVRTLRAETRVLAKKRIFEIVEQTAAAMGATADIDWHRGYPVTENDAGETDRVLEIARDALGGDRVSIVEHPEMGGEDFSFYGQHVPACFYLIGVRPEGQEDCPRLHQPDFDFNDDAIPVGVEMMCRLAVS